MKLVDGTQLSSNDCATFHLDCSVKIFHPGLLKTDEVKFAKVYSETFWVCNFAESFAFWMKFPSPQQRDAA